MMEEMYGEGWKGMFAVSFLFTWVIGLTPPCLIRFVFLKRPVSKIAAVVTSGLFIVINLVVFILLGSQSKSHMALFFVAWVSYGILRISGSASSSEKHNDLSVNVEKDQPAGNTQPVKEDLSDMNDDAFYDEVAKEMQEDRLVPGVWTRAFAEADGDENRAKATYIKVRVGQLSKEAEEKKRVAEKQRIAEEKQFEEEELRKEEELRQRLEEPQSIDTRRALLSELNRMVKERQQREADARTQSEAKAFVKWQAEEKDLSPHVDMEGKSELFKAQFKL